MIYSTWRLSIRKRASCRSRAENRLNGDLRCIFSQVVESDNSKKVVDSKQRRKMSNATKDTCHTRARPTTPSLLIFRRLHTLVLPVCSPFRGEIVPGLGWTASTQHGHHRNRQVARTLWLIDRGAASETQKQATTDAKRRVGARVRRVGGRYSLDVVAS